MGRFVSLPSSDLIACKLTFTQNHIETIHLIQDCFCFLLLYLQIPFFDSLLGRIIWHGDLSIGPTSPCPYWYCLWFSLCRSSPIYCDLLDLLMIWYYNSPRTPFLLSQTPTSIHFLNQLVLYVWRMNKLATLNSFLCILGGCRFIGWAVVRLSMKCHICLLEVFHHCGSSLSLLIKFPLNLGLVVWFNLINRNRAKIRLFDKSQ